MIYLTKEQHLLKGRGSIGWLRIRMPRTASAATRRLTSSEPCQSRTGQTSRASPRCIAMAQTDTSARRR
jgi:hypothetical protein